MAAWAVVIYQAFLGAIAHVWWYRAVKEVGASRSAIFMNLQPVVGVLLAWALLGERVGAAELAGGAAVLGGVALTTQPGRSDEGERPATLTTAGIARLPRAASSARYPTAGCRAGDETSLPDEPAAATSGGSRRPLSSYPAAHRRAAPGRRGPGAARPCRRDRVGIGAGAFRRAAQSWCRRASSKRSGSPRNSAAVATRPVCQRRAKRSRTSSVRAA